MGIFASFISAFFASAKDLVSKRLAFNLDGTASTFASFAYALPYYSALMLFLVLMLPERPELPAAFWLYVVLRSSTDSFAEWMKMYAFSHGDISVVSSFLSLSPVFLLLTSPIITGDRPSLIGVTGVLLGVAGSLLLVYHRSSGGWARHKKAILLGAGASLFFSLNNCFDRLAVHHDVAGESLLQSMYQPTVAGFAMTGLSALIIAPFLLVTGRSAAGLRGHTGPLLVRGLLEILFMVSKLYALQTLQAPYVTGIQRLSLLFSILGGWLFFKEKEIRRRLAAGLLILAGAMLIALEKPILDELRETWPGWFGTP
jgi:drug/metabolite transporter (DMT)-like permease